MSTGEQHAAIVGTGVAGLLLARVLRLHNVTVTLIDAKSFDCDSRNRAGSRNCNHPHIVLERTYQTLRRLFPGIDIELKRGGANTLDWCADVLFITEYGEAPRFRSKIQLPACDRGLLEASMRRILFRDPGVNVIGNCLARNLITDEITGQVKGIEIQGGQKLTGRNGAAVCADLVIIATGANQTILQSILPEKPQVHAGSIPSRLAFASRYYRKPSSKSVDWKAMCISGRPPENCRGGLIYPIENDNWIVCLSGTCDDALPSDDRAFVEFAKRLPSSLLYEAIVAAEPISDVYGTTFIPTDRTNLLRCSRLPVGLCIVGDAVCSLNPLSAKGMACAAIAADTMDECFRRLRGGASVATLSLAFQKRLTLALVVPRYLASLESRVRQGVEMGNESLCRRLLNWYERQVTSIAARDPDVFKDYIEAYHLMRHPLCFFRPNRFARVIGEYFFGCSSVAACN